MLFSVFSVLLIIYVFYEFAMSLTRRQEVVMSCAVAICKQLEVEVRDEQLLYGKRNYAQGNKGKKKDIFYLRLAEILNKGRIRLAALGIPGEQVDALMSGRFKVCRKNSRGHTGV